jgi:hypothetical protein
VNVSEQSTEHELNDVIVVVVSTEQAPDQAVDLISETVVQERNVAIAIGMQAR